MCSTAVVTVLSRAKVKPEKAVEAKRCGKRRENEANKENMNAEMNGKVIRFSFNKHPYSPELSISSWPKVGEYGTQLST